MIMQPSVETVIVPRSKDLGGFEVRRVLPSIERRMIGPFVFWDHMGPAIFEIGHGIDVRPHPHIGLATVTYLLEGDLMHRDSLGSVQQILPGACNWMTAGSGIVHSERTAPQTRLHRSPVQGIQSWIALPKSLEETNPSFVHYGEDKLPLVEGEGMRTTVIAGEIFGAKSPVTSPWDMFYGDVRLDAGARIQVPAKFAERGIYMNSGSIEIDGAAYGAGRMLVLLEGADIVVTAIENTRLFLLGGEPMDGPRHLWWNFVSSSKERIDQAKIDWKEGRFMSVPDETEFIPLPN